MLPDTKETGPAPVVTTFNPPVPVLISIAVVEVTLPMVTVLAAAPVAILTASVLASVAKLRAANPPVNMVALPEREERPLAANVVAATGLGVVLPKPNVGGAAKTAAKFDGCTNKAVTPGTVAVPATASASVASSPIPFTAVSEIGAPAIAKLSA